MAKKIRNIENKSKERISHGCSWHWAAGCYFLLHPLCQPRRWSGGTPSLTVDQNKIDYGYVKFGENRQFALKVSNTGDGTLRFKEKPYVEVLEGC